MSVNIISQPPVNSAGQNLNSANNPSIFTVASALSGQTDYLYVADVLVNSVKSVTLKSYPDPQYGFGVFDLNSVANKFVSFDFPVNETIESETAVYQAPNSSCLIELLFREQYVSGSTFYAPSGTTSSGVLNYINAGRSFTDDLIQPINLYIIAIDSGVSNFLTTPSDYPDGMSVYRRNAPTTLRQWLYFFSYSGSTSTPYIHFVTYDSGGEQIGHYLVDNPYSATTGVKYITVGYPQLVNLDSDSYTVLDGPSNIITDDVASYLVGLGYDPDDIPGSPVTFYIQDECTKFTDIYSVYWLNELGGFDSFRFFRKNITTATKAQTPYKKIQGTLNADGTYTRTTYDPSMINFYTEVTTSIQLNSDWLNDTQVNFLKNMFSSPAIFIEDSTGVIQAATIPDNSYVLNRRVNGTRAYSLQINFNLSSTSYRQLL